MEWRSILCLWVIKHRLALSRSGLLRLLLSRKKLSWPRTVLMSHPESLQSLQERCKDVSPSCPAVSSKSAMSRSGQTIAQQSPFHINLLTQEISSRGEGHNST